MIESIDVLRFCLLVVFTEAVTEILVAAKITDGLRGFIFRKANPDFDRDLPENQEPRPGPALWRFIHDLFSCGYCMSVWVSFGSAFVAPRWLLPDVWGGAVVNWLVMVFAIHRICNFFHVIFSIIKKGRAKTYDIELVHRRVDDNGSNG